jgi:hypothetical protein
LEIIRKISKPAAFFLAVQMLMLSGLYQSVSAAMIGTESIINADRGQRPRDYLNNLLAREKIQVVLISYGIDPQEARDRIDNLSDDEIAKFGHKIDQLPAGAGDDDIGIITLFLVAILLILIDIFYPKPTEK